MFDSFVYFVGANPSQFVYTVLMVVFGAVLVLAYVDAARQKRRAKHRRNKYSRPVRMTRVNHSENADYFSKITHYYNTV